MIKSPPLYVVRVERDSPPFGPAWLGTRRMYTTDERDASRYTKPAADLDAKSLRALLSPLGYRVSVERALTRRRRA